VLVDRHGVAGLHLLFTVIIQSVIIQSAFLTVIIQSAFLTVIIQTGVYVPLRARMGPWLQQPLPRPSSAGPPKAVTLRFAAYDAVVAAGYTAAAAAEWSKPDHFLSIPVMDAAPAACTLIALANAFALVAFVGIPLPLCSMLTAGHDGWWRSLRPASHRQVRCYYLVLTDSSATIYQSLNAAAILYVQFVVEFAAGKFDVDDVGCLLATIEAVSVASVYGGGCPRLRKVAQDIEAGTLRSLLENKLAVSRLRAEQVGLLTTALNEAVGVEFVGSTATDRKALVAFIWFWRHYGADAQAVREAVAGAVPEDAIRSTARRNRQLDVPGSVADLLGPELSNAIAEDIASSPGLPTLKPCEILHETRTSSNLKSYGNRATRQVILFAYIPYIILH